MKTTMKTYEIREHDVTFARIEARTARAALNKAHRLFRWNLKSDVYNGYVGPVTWTAWLPGVQSWIAEAELTVRVRP